MPKLLICVVDDDESVRAALDDLFSGHGYRVETFGCAQAILEFSELADINCIVSDYHMADINGLELCKILRERELDTPFILMTAFATEQLRIFALRKGIVHVLEKPFEPEDILNCVRSATR